MNTNLRLEPNPTWVAVRRVIRSSVHLAESGCWIWQRPLGPEGYGRCCGRSAHRLSYEAWVGPIGYGLDIDHLCRHRACVNPKHLEPVTRKENLKRGIGVAQQKERASQRTQCEKGHELSASNTYVRPSDGARLCRVCRQEHDREYRHATKDAINARRREWRHQWKLKGVRK